MTQQIITLPRLRPDQSKVFDSQSLYRVLMCGRRWGKTTGAYQWVCRGLVAGESCCWVAPTYTYLDTVWQTVCRTLEPVIERKDAQKHRIYTVNGGVAHFWSAEKPDPGRGEKYHRLVVDEAGLIRKFGAVWNESLFPTLADYMGRAVIQGTPKGASRDFVKLHHRGKQGEDGYAAFSGKTADNPLIPTEVIENARKVMTEEQFRQEFEGIPAESGGNPFGIKAIAACTKQMGAGPAVCFGVDLASSTDWTVVIGLNGQGEVCSFDRFQGDWEHVTNRVRGIIGNTPALVDSTGVGSPILQRLQQYSNVVEGQLFTQSSKQEMMVGLAAAFQTGEITIPDDDILLNELESFGYEYREGGRVRYSAPDGMHDDCVCALALAWQHWTKEHGHHASTPIVVFSSPRVRQQRTVGRCL